MKTFRYINRVILVICVINTILAIFDGRMAAFLK